MRKVIFLFAVIVLASCGSGSGSDDSSMADFGGVAALTGTWVGSFPGETYTINVQAGTFAAGYEGNNMIVVQDGDDSGRLIFKYTKAYNSNGDGTVDNPYYSTDSSKAPDVGKWYAVYFKILTRNAIKLSGGYLASGPNSFATKEECQQKMTVAGGYFAQSSECSRR